MGKITVKVSDEVEKDLRTFVAISGYKRGMLSVVVEEALKDYISRHRIAVKEKGEIEFNLKDLEKGKFYLVEVDGEKYALRVTEDNRVQLYEVLE
ncbi:MAG: hypothetical protein MPF33_07980 [Candidatus Aramenus sp.]|jgi:predicted transcriptional regulator|nr:hypothetical protein [Candidatus Aramenus sp.]